MGELKARSASFFDRMDRIYRMRGGESGNAEKRKGDSVTEGFVPSKPWLG
jgi:hypothetical protein